MLELVWLQTARDDLLSIVDYISDDDPRAAQRLKDDIAEKVARLHMFPEMGRTGRVDGTRELVAMANYLVVYQYTPDIIHILRVLHAAQQWPPDTL